MTDGGPAFPTHVNHWIGGLIREEISGGMSLRDWFAGMALQGIRAGNSTLPLKLVATLAWQDADAMITEKNKD